MADGLLVERLRQYLRDLNPDARALLIAELERGLLRGDDAPGAELVLQELRRSAREPSRPSSRTGSLARLFFQPLEPFLVDDTASHNHPGRIARVALDPIWQWICRDLLPGEAKAVTDEVARAFSSDDTAKAEALRARSRTAPSSVFAKRSNPRKVTTRPAAGSPPRSERRARWRMSAPFSMSSKHATHSLRSAKGCPATSRIWPTHNSTM